jgi:hypothetical protein
METATSQELRSAPSLFDIIIWGIFSHTVGLQLLTWTDCKVASDNTTLLPLRCCCHDLPDPYSLHFLQLFFSFPGLGYSEDGGSKLLRRPIHSAFILRLPYLTFPSQLRILNLRSVAFILTPFGWMRSITLTPYSWRKYFWFTTFRFKTFPGKQLRRKTMAGCTPIHMTS